MSDLHVSRVFTPTSQAKANYVDREFLNNMVYDAFTTPGMQVVVYGESGAGKTTLLRKKLEEYEYPFILSRCTTDTTYEGLLLDAFDQLEASYTSETKEDKELSARAGLKASIAVIRAGIEANHKSASSETQLRMVPPQLTAQKLAELLGPLGACWVLEDFHKVGESVRTSISQTLKLFCDTGADYEDVRLILVGAVDSARLVVKYDGEMKNRVAEIEVPVLSDAELSAIISNGSRLLNIDMSLVQKDIVRFSSGLGSVCHRLALDCCREAGVYEHQQDPQNIEPGHLRNAVTRYIETSSDSLRAIFEDAVERKRVRKFDNGRLILKALALGSRAGMNHAEILAEIQKEEPDYRPSNLTTYLNRMIVGDGAILRQSGKTYRFAEPVYRSYAQFRFHGEVQDDVQAELNDKHFTDNELYEIFKDLEIDWK